jgi:hypothetical protein
LNATTPAPDDGRHAVAVVRVEVRDGTSGELLIEVIEVGRERDRLLGRATNTADACRVLEGWLRDLLTGADREAIARPEDDGVTGQ